jgi:hypothetical protein
VSGSGAGTVTTAALYEPGQAYELATGAAAQVLVAGEDGRLVVPVDLGTPNAYQQDTGPAMATSTTRTVEVRILPLDG